MRTVLACLIVIGLAVIPTAWAGQRTKAVSHTVASSAAKIKRIERFWTPKRMRHAKPLPLGGGRDVAATPSSAPTSSTGAPKAIPPSLPKGDKAGSEQGRRAVLVRDPSRYPYSTNGKLFFRVPGQGAFRCSATVVNTPSERVIFSAGHCAVDNGVWSTNVAFVPAYQHGHLPYGIFVAHQLWSLTPWIDQEDFSYDMSAMVLWPRVANTVGSRGIAWNQSRLQHFVSFGYPAVSPFNGQDLYDCPSFLRGRDNNFNPPTMWITCNMTQGSSGGGWIIKGAYLNSVNSYGYPGLPNRLYGPYFGDGARVLYNAVKYR